METIMQNTKTLNLKTTVAQAPVRQRAITDPSEFLRWLIDTLNQQGPRMRVDHDTAAAVWTFVDQLVQGDQIECPEISSVELFFQNQWTDVGTVELGRVMFMYLAAMGEYAQLGGGPSRVPMDILISHAVWTWDGDRRFIQAEFLKGQMRLRSTDLMIAAYGIKVDVSLPFYEFC